MDMLFIDISDSNLNVNDRVEIFGNNHSIFKMAYEIYYEFGQEIQSFCN